MKLFEDEEARRVIPGARWEAAWWLTVALVVAWIGAWEWKMRSLGLRAGDLGDSASHWTVERRKIAAGEHDDVVIFGSSRILFDTDLAVWQQMTGRRPAQLALPGTSPRFLLTRFARDADFAGLVIVGVTPESFFSEFTTAFPAYLTVNDLWRTESPSKRFGHGIGLLLSRYLAFLDDNYRLGQLIDRVNIPDRPGVRRPFMEVWKLSETSEDRQYFLWPRLMSDQRLLAHARAVWLARGQPPAAADLIARICSEVAQDVALIRSRGGEVVFVRPPSSGAYYEREQTAAPRAATWDRLLRETGAPGIHFEDYQDMQDLEIPEMSHLSRDSATRFTRAYVEVLVGQYPWLDRTTRAGAAT
jgi:hypothetical protein